jgi:hypothetical protein
MIDAATPDTIGATNHEVIIFAMPLKLQSIAKKRFSN